MAAQNGVGAPSQQDGGSGDGSGATDAHSSTCSANKDPHADTIQSSADANHPHDHTRLIIGFFGSLF